MPADTVIIRPVEPRDAEQLCENCFSMNTPAEVQARIESEIRAREQGSGILLVAEVGGVVIGTATLIRNTHPLYSHRGELASLVVHPDYQRRGIARHLVEGICTHAVSMGLEILLTNCRGGTPAENVYPRLGFREYGRLPRGIVESWGERQAFDETFFYMPVAKR
jgi:acetyltransferase